MPETYQRKINVQFNITDISKTDNVKCDFDRIADGDEKYIRFVDHRTTFWSPYDRSVLTYRRSGVGLPKTDSFRLDGGLVLLD